MDIRKLYEAAMASVAGRTIVISKDKSGIYAEAGDALGAVFDAMGYSGLSFSISMPILRYEEGQDIFSISVSDPCEISKGYFFQCISFSVSALRLVCGIDNRGLDEDGKLMLFHCTQSFSADYYAPAVTEEVTGTLQAGTVQLFLAGGRNEYGAFEYRLEEKGDISVAGLLSGFFDLFSIPMFIEERYLPLRFSYIKAVFEENSSGEGVAPNDSFTVEAAIDLTQESIGRADTDAEVRGFGIDGKFGMDSLVFCFEKYGCEYAFGVGGRVRALSLEPLDFMARYEGDGIYLFGVNGEGGPAFGFSQIAELTGTEVREAFPEEAAGAQGLRLKELTVHTDFKAIQSFHIKIMWEDRWVICAKPELALSDICLWADIAGKEKSYGMEGTVTLFGKDIRIAAVYAEGGNWVFHGELSPYTPIKLGEMVEKAAQWFGAPDFAVPLEVEVAGFSVAVGLNGDFAFTGMVLAGGSKDSNLAKILNGKCRIAVKRRLVEGIQELDADIAGTVNICGNQFQLSYESKEGKALTARFEAKDKGELSFPALLRLFGGDGLADALPDCLALSLSELSLDYRFAGEGKELRLQAKLNAFEVEAVIGFGGETDYTVTVNIHGKIALSGLPVAGAFLEPGEDSSVSGFLLEYSKKEGFVFGCRVCGEEMRCVLVPPAGKPEGRRIGEDREETDRGTVKWLPVNKAIGVFALNRLGISIQGSRLGILADVSLLVNPFTFELLGAGIEAEAPSLRSPRFLLEGFGVDFQSAALSVSGAFRYSDGGYAGEVKASAGSFSLAVMGEFREGGLTAYGVFSYPLGGPPCFVVTGLAAAFGYNRDLRLPDIGRVAEYPLVTAAMEGYDRKRLISGLQEYVTECSGGRFLAAGVKFTSFEVVKGFALLTASFGRNTEIGLLGLADIMMPPNSGKTPAAKAQLALKVAVMPAAGLVSCEARLSESSYIFSENCRLQGGFALCLWFAGLHKGDFVVTLGGYHPMYKKPDHYPDVPRLGFHWDVLPVHNRLVLSGEFYFALTPSAMMAGGKLSAVYSMGGLKAYFIAYADFLLQWKPFAYDARIGVALGASYRVDKWFIHHTFTVELSADLYIWGPEFSGKARVKWFILSFTIPFGDTEREEAPALQWEEFRDSFIPAAEGWREGLRSAEGSRNPLSVKLSGEMGMKTEEGDRQMEESAPRTEEDAGQPEEAIRPAVRADDFSVSVYTMVPIKNATLSGEDREACGREIPIQPMSGTLTKSLVTVRLVEGMGKSWEKELKTGLQYTFLYGNIPAALWAKKGESGELVENMPVGVLLRTKEYMPQLFPQEGDINEDALKEAEKLEVADAFREAEAPAGQTYGNRGTVEIFRKTGGRVSAAGRELLKSLGYTGEISLPRYAVDADFLLDDDILIGSVGNEICG